MTKLMIKLSLLCFLIAFTSVWTSSSYAWIQSLRSGMTGAGTDGSCRFYKPGDSTWLYQRYDMIVPYAECPEFIATWRARNPNARLCVYTSGTDMPAWTSSTSINYNSGGKATWIKARMIQLGDTAEHAYLHFYDDTKVNNYSNGSWDTLLIPGTYSMTIAAKDSVSRVPNGYVSSLFTSRNTYAYPARLSPNFANKKLRQAYKEYVTKIFTAADVTHYWPAATGYYDGVFFDNYSYMGIQGSHLVSGGHVVETGTNSGNLLTFASDAYGAWGWQLQLAFGREVRDTLRTSNQWSADHKKKILAYNFGNYYKDILNNPDSSGADIIHYEYGWDPVTSNNASIHRLESLYARDSILTSNGGTPYWCSVPRTSYGGYTATTKQAIYNNLCFYYVARTDSTWIYMYPTVGYAYAAFLNTGFDTLAWVPAMEHEMGQPSAHYQLVSSGASPDEAGATYKVFVRDYQYGKVYSRPRDGFNAKWGDASIAVTVNLGGSYRQVLTDNTLGPVITALSLRGGAGALVIPATSGDCSTPPTIPALSSPADGAATTATPTVCVTNSTQSGCSQPIRYHFQVSSLSNFSSITAQDSAVVQGASSTCWVVSTSLALGRRFYWRARAGNGTYWSAWSTVRTLTTPNSPPSAPTPSSPANAASLISLQPDLVVLNSTDPEGVTPTYDFQVSKFSNFTPIVAENSAVAQGVSTTTWTVSPQLENLQTYYWRVRASDGIGFSSWSTVRSFTINQTVNNLPTTPTLNAPTNNSQVATLTPDLRVNNSTDADGDPLTYQFEIHDSTTASLLYTSTMIASGTGATAWTVTSALTNNIKYSWRARAYDTKGWSGWMTWAYFRVVVQQNHPPSVPVPMTPVEGDTVVGSFHVLVIDNSTDQDGDNLTYSFRVFSDSALTKQVEISPPVSESDPYTIFSTTATYTNNKPYYWRVRTYDGQSWCNWSSAQKFWHLDMLLDVQDAPVLLSPADGSVEMNVRPLFRVNWAGGHDTSLCFFEVAFDSGFVNIADAGSAVGLSRTAEWTPSQPLENGKTYHWRARREDGGFGSSASFSVNAAVFVSPNPFSYLDGDLTVHNLPAGSRLEVYTTSGELVAQIDGLSGNYSWNVRNSAGEKLASGVYLYYVKVGDNTIADKFVVVR